VCRKRLVGGDVAASGRFVQRRPVARMLEPGRRRRAELEPVAHLTRRLPGSFLYAAPVFLGRRAEAHARRKRGHRVDQVPPKQGGGECLPRQLLAEARRQERDDRVAVALLNALHTDADDLLLVIPQLEVTHACSLPEIAGRAERTAVADVGPAAVRPGHDVVGVPPASQHRAALLAASSRRDIQSDALRAGEQAAVHRRGRSMLRRTMDVGSCWATGCFLWLRGRVVYATPPHPKPPRRRKLAPDSRGGRS
jgi:hypothetical protein